MLDQKKTGMFISEMRKEKGLTQKQLASEIGVSDKAVSKWENGRGMPDTSLIPDLCRVLGINLNELLSGERLSEDAYSGKAENNMVELIKNNEKAKRENTGSAIGTIIGIVFLCLFVYGITIISGGMTQIIWFLDAPSLVAVLGIQFIILGASGQFYNYFRSFRLVFAPKSYNPEELKLLADKSEYAVSFGIKALLMAGCLSSIIGFVMAAGTIGDLSILGPLLAVAVLTMFYSVLISLFMYVIKGRVHKIYEE